MKSLVGEFEEFIAAPAPGFICSAYGKRRRWVAPLAHHVEAGATEDELRWLGTLSIPNVDHIVEFVSRFNGVHLFDGPTEPIPDLDVDPQLMRPGVKLFPVRQWEEKTEGCREEWLTKIGSDQGDIVYGMDDFISIGMPCRAWNHIHLIVRGDLAGRTYFWPWTMPAFQVDEGATDSFEHLVRAIMEEPGAMLSEFFGGYTRYWDGRTHIQWNPDKYVADRRMLPADTDGYLRS